jgi:hypothetical protein
MVDLQQQFIARLRPQQLPLGEGVPCARVNPAADMAMQLLLLK